MATSSLSSLGLGSDGALSYDVIDQLRAVDNKAQVTPIDNKLESNATKQSDLSIITTLTASLKSVTSTLSDEMSYLQRTSSVSNSAVSVTASAGSAIQDFALHVNNLAQRDIYQSTGFTSETATFSNSTLLSAGTVIAPSVLKTDGSTAIAANTESSVVTFDAAGLLDGESITIGGLTLTAIGNLSQAELMAAFENLSEGSTPADTASQTWSGSLTGFSSGAISGSTITFTSITPDSNVADLTLTTTGATIVNTTDGNAEVLNVTESSVVTFDVADMSLGDTLTIGGLTLTATGTMTQADVIAAFANLNAGATKGNTVANGTWSGTLTGFSSGTATGSSLTFTSSTSNADVADLMVAATQQIAGTDTVPANYTLSIKIGTKTYDIDMQAGTTLSELKSKINDATDGKVIASLLNVGGTNPYKLIIKSADTGENNTISFSSTSISALRNLGLDSASLETNGNHLQTAKDASFTYNGVTVSRSSNTIDDLVVGLSITLNEAQSEATTVTNVSIKQDLTDVKDGLNSLVTKYNELISNLNEATKYDTDTKASGTFQGVSQITSLAAEIRKQLLAIDEFGRSLVDYGISLNEGGILEFNATTFDQKVSSSASDVEDFLRGSTSISTTTFRGNSVSAGDLTFNTGDLTINGVAIIFSTIGNDAAANALALQNAINNAGITGIEASIGANDSIQLKSTAGYDITIKGDETKLSSIGFQATSIKGKSSTRDGFFTDFNSLLASYVSGTESILSLFETSLSTEKTSLTKEKALTVSRLDSRYAIMAARFAAYDTIISQLNHQFQSLSMMIQQSYNNSN